MEFAIIGLWKGVFSFYNPILFEKYMRFKEEIVRLQQKNWEYKRVLLDISSFMLEKVYNLRNID